MKKPVYTTLARFHGHLNLEELNDAIRAEFGDDTLCFESEEDYSNAIKQGFIEFDGNDTLLLSDEA